MSKSGLITVVLGNGGSWTAPPAVTTCTLAPCNSTGQSLLQSYICNTIVPNTSYAITIVGAGAFSPSVAPSSFGFLFTWTGTTHIKISWIE